MDVSIFSHVNPFAFASPALPETIKTREDIKVEIGSSNRLVDVIRNTLSIPAKILLWSSKFNSGGVSGQTIERTKDFLHENDLHDVAICVNQYNPKMIWQRIFSNPKTCLLSKCTVGVGNGLIETIACPKLTGFPGDHYDVMSNTVQLFSDDLALALHECGHAKDFNERKNPVLYGMMRNIPRMGMVATLYQEIKATDYAIAYLSKERIQGAVKKAFKILIPAYATYCAIAAKGFMPTTGWHFSCDKEDFICDKENTEINLFLAFWIPMLACVTAGHILARVLAPGESEQNDAQSPRSPKKYDIEQPLPREAIV